MIKQIKKAVIPVAGLGMRDPETRQFIKALIEKNDW